MYERIISFKNVMDAYSDNHKVCDKKTIRRAYEYAATKHMGMKRGSGEPFINHPLRVALFIAKWGFESDTIAAALLHDTIEDCGADLHEIHDLFGSNIAQIIDAVTALSDKDYSDHDLTKAQKDILSDARLQRKMNEKALYVKIADRIDNLYTLDGVPEEKRIPKAEHTREIIIPMAVLAHAYAYADTLEELCFEIEHPHMYQMIRERSKEIREENYRLNSNTIALLKELFISNSQLDGEGLESYQQYFKEMIYEQRSCVSIYHQITREAENIKRDWKTLLVKERMPLYDLTFIIRDKIRDDINNPHPYQLFFVFFEKILSTKGFYLLSAGSATYGKNVYIIVSDEMDNLYRVFIKTESDHNRYLYGNIIDDVGEFSIKDVNEIEPRDTYNKKIKVFDKDNHAVIIDEGATVLDFAFYIHTDLGLHFDYALYEESKTRLPAHTRLNEGDVITIIANEQVTPSITWFNFLKTRRAVHHLVSYFQGKIVIENGH